MDKLNPRLAVALICLLLSVVTAATYWPALHHEFINYDDPDYVTENDWVQRGLTWDGVKWAFTTGHASNWHPLTWLSHMLDVQLFGMGPIGHHGTNVVLHTANSVLLLLLLWQMTGAIWRSALVAGLFALHPLHVESVAWVAERKDVLSTFFGLLCLMAYARYVAGDRWQVTGNAGTTPHPARLSNQGAAAHPDCDHPLPARCATLSHPIGEGYLPEAERAKRTSKAAYALAFLFLALGLMSKPMLVTWPFVMLLLDVWPLRRVTGGRWTKFEKVATPHPTLSPGEAERASQAWKRLVLEKLPLLALVIGSCVITVLVQSKGGAVTTAFNLPLGDRLENAVASYVKYLGKTLCPTNLAIFYPHPETRYPISDQWPLWVIGLAALLLVGLCVFAFRRREQQPYLLAGWLWYLGTLVPVIGIVQVGTQAMADRYTYIPLIGIFVAGVWGIAELTRKNQAGRLAGPALGLIAIVVCTIASRSQLRHWQSSFTVFAHAVTATRNNAPAHGNLGTEYVKRGEVEEGIKHFRAALEADPHFADAAYSLGLVEQTRGNLEAAAEYYRDALKRRPDHVLANHNLGTVLWLQGNTAAAEGQFREALALAPDHTEANANLGNLLLELRRPDESRAYLEAALQRKPDSTYARLGLGLAFKMQGELTPAAEQFRRVLEAEPDNLEAKLNLGIVLADAGQTNEATRYLSQVTQAKPQLDQELLQTGRTLAAQGKVAAATDQLRAALHLKPDNAIALELLAQLQAQAGKLQEATGNFERALALSPSADANYFLGAIKAVQGDAPAAITNFQQAIQLKPDFLAALNELAWLLATHPDEKMRNGPEAVRLAERACAISGDKEARYWGTLDAAYAEAGRFPEAIQTAEKARKLAAAANQTELAEAAAQRLSYYIQNRPFHQK